MTTDSYKGDLLRSLLGRACFRQSFRGDKKSGWAKIEMFCWLQHCIRNYIVAPITLNTTTQLSHTYLHTQMTTFLFAYKIKADFTSSFHWYSCLEGETNILLFFSIVPIFSKRIQLCGLYYFLFMRRHWQLKRKDFTKWVQDEALSKTTFKYH